MLKEDEMRDKILQDTLSYINYDNKDVFKFLLLLNKSEIWERKGSF